MRLYEITSKMSQLVGELKRTSMGRQADYRKESETELSVRYFGEWVSSNPDDEDDDWESPTKETFDAVKAICKKYGATFDVGEKNWIYFRLPSVDAK